MFEGGEKIQWLRSAANEGFEAIDRGDYIALNSGKEIDACIKEIQAEVSAQPAAGDVRA